MLLDMIASSGRLKNLSIPFKSRNYRLYFGGQSLSLIGTWMQNIAMSWLVYRITGSVFLLGVISFANQIPSFFFSPFAGVLTDKYDRKKIMIWTQVLFMVQALLFAVLTLTNVIEVWHIIVLSVFFGFISVFDTPARQSLVVDLIEDRRYLGNMIALNSAIFNGARLVGPGIAGMVIAYTGEGICFLINAFSFLVIIIALSQIIIKPQIVSQVKTNIWGDLQAGFKYTFGEKAIKLMLIIVSLFSLMGLPVFVLLPAYAKEILAGDSKTLGFLMSAAGFGAFSAALFLATRSGVKGLAGIITLALFVFGIATLGLAFLPFQPVVYVFLFLCGFGIVASIAAINTLIQSFVSDNMRGRVLSFYAIALMGMNPVGSFLAGTSASTIGTKYTIFIEGVICLIIGLYYLSHKRLLDRFN